MTVARWTWAGVAKFAIGLVVGSALSFLLAGSAAGWMVGANAAAWVQAIGSVLGILVAGAIPFWDDRIKRGSARRELLDLLGALAVQVRDLSDVVCDVAHDGAKRRGLAEFASFDEYEPLLQALNRFPTHQLTEAFHLSTLMHLQRYAKQGDRMWRMLVSDGHDDEPFRWTEFKERARELADEAGAATANVLTFR